MVIIEDDKVSFFNLETSITDLHCSTLSEIWGEFVIHSHPMTEPHLMCWK